MTYRDEIKRKLFHQIGLFIPVMYLLTSKTFVLTLLIPATIIVLVVDVSRLYVPPVRRLFLRIFGSMIREHEGRKLTGSSYFMPACTISIIAFPKEYAIMGLFFLIVSDTAAALIGRKYGSGTLFGKSWQGSAAFFLTALIVALFIPGIPSAHKLAAVIAATLLELLPIPLDDNFLIPIGTGLTLIVLAL